MAGTVDLRALLDLEEVLDGTFVARGPHVPGERLFGGQLIAQSLLAADRTVSQGRGIHSLHLYFLRGARQGGPLEYRVTRVRDGRSFSNRRIELWQSGVLLSHGMASFTAGDEGHEHQFDAPVVAPPERLRSFRDDIREEIARLPPSLREFWQSDLGFDVRPVEPFVCPPGTRRAPKRHFWIRASGDVASAGPAFHRAAIAYASDMHLLETGLLPHDAGWTTSSDADASLDHAIWFYGDAKVDDWLLYAMESPCAARGRVHARGSLFDRGGRLLALVVQEGTVRSTARSQ